MVCLSRRKKHKLLTFPLAEHVEFRLNVRRNSISGILFSHIVFRLTYSFWLVQTYIQCQGHVPPQFSQFHAILLNFHPVFHPNIWREKGFCPLWPGNLQPGYYEESLCWSWVFLVKYKGLPNKGGWRSTFPTRVSSSEMVLCPILWGINYHIFMPVRLDEISNSIVDTRLKFVHVHPKTFGTVYTYFF